MFSLPHRGGFAVSVALFLVFSAKATYDLEAFGTAGEREQHRTEADLLDFETELKYVLVTAGRSD